MPNIILTEKSAQGEAALQWKLPLNPKSWKVGILSHFPDMDKAPGKGNFPSSNDLGLSRLQPQLLLLWVTLTHAFALWPHCLVTAWLCVTNSTKRMLPGSWSPSVPPPQSCPYGLSVHAILSPAEAPWAVISPPFLRPFSCPSPPWLTSLGLVLGCCARHCTHISRTSR